MTLQTHFPATAGCDWKAGETCIAQRRMRARADTSSSSADSSSTATGGFATESDGLLVEASPGISASAQMYAEIEARLADSGSMETVGLRYGFFYGPKTWYSPDGAVGTHVLREEMPLIGNGEGVWSWIHIEDAAKATAAAITIPPGLYNIVDDDPSPIHRWLPAFADWLGAPPPPHISEDQARDAAGADAVFYATRLSGASNEKARADIWIFAASIGVAGISDLPQPPYLLNASMARK